MDVVYRMTSISSFMEDQEEIELKAKNKSDDNKNLYSRIIGLDDNKKLIEFFKDNKFAGTNNLNWKSSFEGPITRFRFNYYINKLEFLWQKLKDYPEKNKDIIDEIKEASKNLNKQINILEGRVEGGGRKRRTRRGKTKRLRKTRRTKN